MLIRVAWPNCKSIFTPIGLLLRAVSLRSKLLTAEKHATDGLEADHRN